MNGSRAANAALVADIVAAGVAGDDVELLVCPPFPYLGEVAAAIGNAPVALGAQTLSEHPPGAVTGEVAAAMLADIGVRYVIVGHSERRELFAESDAQVAAKFAAALAAGLTPVLCVGETLEEREAGQTEAVVARQLDAVLKLSGGEAFARAVVAYEPVWAIGTGKTATPDMAEEVHAMLRRRLRDASEVAAGDCRILYGGSMKPDNAAGLLSQANIDGGLIGGASLKAADFSAIARAATAAAKD